MTKPQSSGLFCYRVAASDLLAPQTFNFSKRIPVRKSVGEPLQLPTENIMHRKLLLNMLRAVYWYCDALQDNLEAQGYRRTSRTMAFVLLNIAQGEHRAINIARNLGISRQAVGQMLEELKSRDFINV